MKPEMKKKWICCAKLAIIIYGLFFACVYDLLNFKYTLTTAYSPEQNNKIVIKYVEPFPCGTHEIKILYGEKSFFDINKHSYDTDLFNDGMAIYPSNCKIIWSDENNATLQLFGYSYLYNQIYQINFETHEITKR